jgi:hypothetical protein
MIVDKRGFGYIGLAVDLGMERVLVTTTWIVATLRGSFVEDVHAMYVEGKWAGDFT